MEHASKSLDPFYFKKEFGLFEKFPNVKPMLLVFGNTPIDWAFAAFDYKNLRLIFRDLLQECRCWCRFRCRLIVQPLFRFQENAKYRENNIYEKTY